MDTVSPFGRWPSPLEAGDAAAGKVSLADVCSDGSFVYWLESRPRDGGRVVFVRGDEGGVVELSAPGVSIRSRVYEYGGGACCLVPKLAPGAFAYVEASDQRVWLQRGPGEPARALTPVPPEGERWAHGGLGASADGAWVVAVREVHEVHEVHEAGDATPPRRCVVALGTGGEGGGARGGEGGGGGSGESILAEGHDFYGAPRLDTTAQRLAVVAWDHPDMSWDRSAVIVIPLAVTGDTTTGASRLVAAGQPWTVEAGADVSVGQPQWQRDGGLRFVSDRHGWWQPFTHSGRPDGHPAIASTTTAAEFHGPDWALGQCTMAELADGGLVARMTADGRDSIVRIMGEHQPPLLVHDACVSIAGLCAHKDGIAFIGAPPDGPATIWAWAPLRSAVAIRPSPPTPLGPRDVSVGEAFSLVGRSGRPVHGLFYAPRLEGTAGPPDALPPLLVQCHGGPTGSVQAGYDVVVQYFTSRGFAVAAVDYAGSAGYGRAYRLSLWGRWGVADSEDCVDAARYLAAAGRVDGSAMAVRGSSAGGLTALNALAGGEAFAAAVSWYGVTDLLALAETTHDFEAHYTDRLIGPLPACRALYEERSPTRRADEIRGSVLLLQGLDDLVVPPAQTEGLRDALVDHGRHCEVRFFEGEGHGFRRAETVRAALEEELGFYLRVLAPDADAP